MAARAATAVTRSPRRPGDVGRLGALRAFALLELDARAFGERLEALAGDIAVMDEEILPPSSGVMKPYPLLSLNHLTVPVAIEKHLP